MASSRPGPNRRGNNVVDPAGVLGEGRPFVIRPGQKAMNEPSCSRKKKWV